MSDVKSVSKGRLIGEVIGVLVLFIVTILAGVIFISLFVKAFNPDMLSGINPETGEGGEFLSLLGYPLSIIMMLVIIHFTLQSRGSGWAYIGFSKPDSVLKTIGWGVAITVAAVAVATGVDYVMSSLGYEQDLSMFTFIEGNLVVYLFMATIISWFAAALGEEVIFRGIVMGNLAALFGGNKRAWLIAAIVQGVFFGLAHYYQGMSGIVATGSIALVFGFAYYYLRSLWPVIIAHGLIDTYGMTMFYLYGISG